MLYLLVLFLVGSAGMVIVCWKPGLQLPSTTEFQLFDLHEPIEFFDMELRNHFEFLIGDNQLKKSEIDISFIWGVLPVDNGDHLNPESRGSLKVDPAFNFTDIESQKWLDSFCKDLREQDFVDESAKRKMCLPFSFSQGLVNKNCSNFIMMFQFYGNMGQ